MPLSCFSFRPRKLLRKRLKFALKSLVGTGTRFLPERRTQGVLAALGRRLCEEFCCPLTGGILLHPLELPLIERFEYTGNRTDGIEQIPIQRFSVFALHECRLGVDETFLLEL